MVTPAACRGTRIIVDLSAIGHNVRLLRNVIGDQIKLMAVVKANAYGHGIVPVAQTAIANGADWLGVAVPEEGAQLRSAGITSPILVLGGVNEAGAEESVRFRLTQTVFGAEGVRMLNDACTRQNSQIDVHIKIDTGMSRIGVQNEQQLLKVLAALHEASCVHLTGAFTHYADADNPEDTFSREQLARFTSLTALLPSGLLLHAAATDAMLRFSDSHLGMTRAGIALYTEPAYPTDLPFRHALSFLTKVVCVRDVLPGDTVSYGRTFRAPKLMRVATLAVGYGDGYHRACSGRAHVLIGGVECPLIGRICMDQMMADVTDVPGAHAGDDAVLIGKQGDCRITAQMLAQWAGTISYEVLLAPTGRVPVLYKE